MFALAEIRVTHNGLCHSDVHVLRSEWGPTKYPMVPGHEVGQFPLCLLLLVGIAAAAAAAVAQQIPATLSRCFTCSISAACLYADCWSC